MARTIYNTPTTASARSTTPSHDDLLQEARFYTKKDPRLPFYAVQINSSHEKTLNGQYVSDALVDLIKTEAAAGRPFTHVIVQTHGWLTPIDGAINATFSSFIGGLLDDTNKPKDSSFRPLFVGVAWESMPNSFFESDEAKAREDIVDKTLKVVQAFDQHNGVTEQRELNVAPAYTVLKEARHDRMTSRAVYDGLLSLQQELDDEDDTSFDAHVAMKELEKATSKDKNTHIVVAERGLFSAVAGGIAAAGAFKEFVADPLQDVLFGRFIRRARKSGNVLGSLVAKLMKATSASSPRNHVKYALMGHSLGAHLVSTALLSPLPHKVHTALIVQGACNATWYKKGGSYDGIAKNVAGPLVATLSDKDNALFGFKFFHGKALGTVGFPSGAHIPMKTKKEFASNPYEWLPGQLYSIDGSQFIDEGNLVEGGHGDYKEDETTMMYWSMIKS